MKKNLKRKKDNPELFEDYKDLSKDEQAKDLDQVAVALGDRLISLCIYTLICLMVLSPRLMHLIGHRSG